MNPYSKNILYKKYACTGVLNSEYHPVRIIVMDFAWTQGKFKESSEEQKKCVNMCAVRNPSTGSSVFTFYVIPKQSANS
jgi:hypothetical protein